MNNWWEHNDSKKKLYRVTKHVTVPVPELKGLSFKNEFCELKNGMLSIKEGYEWDGCSPKKVILGCVLGTPEGWYNKTKLASLVHDILLHFKICPRKLADSIFMRLLKEACFFFWWLYFAVVRTYSYLMLIKELVTAQEGEIIQLKNKL